jgi:hypothetical protein
MICQCRKGNRSRHSILLEWRFNSFSYLCAVAKGVQAFINNKLEFTACPNCGQRLPVAGFDSHQIAEHADKTTKARNPALSARTVKHLLVTLRGALSVAVKWDLVPRNVATLVEPPKLTKHP